MHEVVILGAAGGVATLVERLLLDEPRVHLTLLARTPEHLAPDIADDRRVQVVKADVTDHDDLLAAITGKDLVYANLCGADLGLQGESVASTMREAGVSRVIWISANGIYGEIPGEYGEWNARMLGPTLDAYAAGAEAIETSDLDYTIIRPAWFSDKGEVSYGISEPGTDGPKPSFY